jgi:hypothetical protein
MTEPATVSTSSPGVVSRAIGIIFSPGQTFAKALEVPSPWGILFLVALVVGLVSAAPYFTESGQQAMLDAQIQAAERFTGQPLPDEAIAAMEARPSTLSIVFAFVGQFIFMPIAALFFGGLFWGLFNAVLGGTASFKHVLTVVSHGMVILALGTVISFPIMLMQGAISMTGPFNLGALVPMLDETSFVARLLGAMNVFTIWQTIVVAIGLAVLYKRKAGSIATGLLLAYVLFTAVLVSVFGAFLGLGG